MIRTGTGAWGALAHPLRTGAATRDMPWLDNAFLAFWDVDHQVFGAVHVSTSPNAPTRRARFSISVDGRSAEIVEPLEPGSFASQSISYDLDGVVSVRSPELSAELELTPRFQIADYTGSQVFKGLSDDEPLKHWQQGAHVVGTVTLGAQTVSVDGVGIRDRTSGYRDMSANIAEYVAVTAGFPDFDLTVMRFVTSDGRDKTEGFLLGETVKKASALSLERDASGLTAACVVTLEDGTVLELTTTRHYGGFWVPMGPARSTGPAISAYDDFLEVRTAHGRTAPGVHEHGILRRLS